MTPTPQSSNIAAVGYDSATSELYVTFVNSGRTYKYLDVPPGEFGMLERADSVGSYFANNIKGQYKTVPV
jgi:hypothetical protein